MFAQIVVRFPGIFRRIDLMAQLLQLNFEVVTQQGIISTTSTRMAVLPSIFDSSLTLIIYAKYKRLLNKAFYKKGP